ncbi:MAG TPA: metalloregulator ArsR/SmtB family transcription factor [Streptosporangiaceae bacterium]|nr:metalloregulator ArsR/SmtB family transcription factor [Streptosporangiaceae bacterium]
MTGAAEGTACAPARPELAGRPLIGQPQAARLEAVFKVLANDTRLRLLHALVRSGQLCVTDLAAAVGLRPQAVSNQLQRLVDRGIVAARRDGNRIWYRVTDPCVVQLLDLAWCLTETTPPAPGDDR